MNKLIIFIIILFSLPGKSQDIKNLFLISGHPYHHTDVEFSSYLWKYSGNSLDTILTLSTKDDYLENVKVYPEQNLVAIHKTNSIRRQHLGDNHRLLLLKYIDSIRSSEVYIDTQGKLDYFLSQMDDYLLLDIYNKETGNEFNKININNLTKEEASIEDFVHAILSGIPGGMIYGKDYFLVYSNETNGTLEIPLIGDRQKRPSYEYVLPEKYQFNKYSRHVVPVNNSWLFAVVGDKKLKTDTIGSRQILIYNKSENNWHDIVIPGSIAKIRGFGNWICGFVFNDYIGEKDLPGSENWKSRESGLSPGERWKINVPGFKYGFAPGVLYLYNTYTKKYIDLKTNQADSEVILIQNNRVIYRAYDELHSAEIIQGEKLDTPKLLLKDNRVPDIHWAFIRN